MTTVLIVEDNELNRDMLARRLALRGFQILEACDGREGIDQALEHRPDLILMDMHMPGVDGWSATAKLKSMPDLAHIPVIGVSAHALPEDRARGLEAGCSAYVLKPVDMDELAQAMQNALGGVES